MRNFATTLFLLLMVQLFIDGAMARAQSSNAEAAADETANAATSEPLTVMTWNLEWFYDEQSNDNFSKLGKEKSTPDRELWDWRRDAFSSSIASSRPTILAVQEAENRRVLWYLTQSLRRNHRQEYSEYAIESRDHYTEQDVGLLVRPPASLLSVTQHAYPKKLRSSNQFYDVSKHLMAEIEFRHGDTLHTVVVLNVHLRARPEGEPFRIRQARLMHRWIREAVQAGRDVIVLGDFNTEEGAGETRKSSDVGIASGLETEDTADDLIDLNLQLPASSRRTHLLPGKQFDRILCSRSLLEDDPSRPDLVFTKIEVLPELCIQGERDGNEEHWDGYWDMKEDARDLSDHYPLMATFEVR